MAHRQTHKVKTVLAVLYLVAIKFGFAAVEADLGSAPTNNAAPRDDDKQTDVIHWGEFQKTQSFFLLGLKVSTAWKDKFTEIIKLLENLLSLRD